MRNSGRVRESTSERINREIDLTTQARIEVYSSSSADDINNRLRRLDEEWDVERVLEMNASTLALVGLSLGTIVSRKWLAVPAIVLPFLLQHSIQGWCPPLPILRRLGIRTRREIDHERYALKLLRGDFSNVGPDSSSEEILQAVRS